LQLFVRGPTPGSHEPGSASGACFVGQRFPWSPALAPPTLQHRLQIDRLPERQPHLPSQIA
jgi:hypothetical protein